MDLTTKNDSFLDLKKSLFISNFYALLVLISYILLTVFAKDYSDILVVYRPYFLIGNSLGGYILSYIWAFMDALTVCIIILGITSLLNYQSKENEPNQSSPDVL